jgi:hypothetical protein
MRYPINIELSEEGLSRVYVGAATDEETRGGLSLLHKIAPELRRLDQALRTSPTDRRCDHEGE